MDESDKNRDYTEQNRVLSAKRKLYKSFTVTLHRSARSRTRSSSYRGGNRGGSTKADAMTSCAHFGPDAMIDGKTKDGLGALNMS